MDKDHCFFIGYFSRIIGIKGEIGLKLDVDQPEHYRNLDFILVQINKRDQSLVPFSLTSIKLQNNGIARLKMADVNDAAIARSLVGKSVFLPLDMLPALGDNQFYFHEITGFEVMDQQYGIIGKVQEVLDYPGQPVLQILHESNKEILIPIHDETVLEVDRKQRQLKINAPEGLIALYLDEIT